MPLTAVYFVSPRLIASTAACLILCGVSKSGSPALSPITSTPDSRNFLALSDIAMVAEGLTRDKVSDKKEEPDINKTP